jgi:sec-independent protein translocase protein TatC
MSTSINFADGVETERFGDGGRMSLFEHLDELRRRLVRSLAFVCVAFVACWFVSDRIYGFLSVPIKTALADARRAQMPALSIEDGALPLASLPDGAVSRYVFAESSRLGGLIIPPGASALARVARAGGRTALLTEEPLIVGGAVLPKGTALPFDPDSGRGAGDGEDDRLIVSTAMEPFSLYLKVSLYGAFSLSVPFLLLQLWGFISPGLHRHERGYVLPFVSLSSVSFLAGALFAYYVIFPPAAVYLLGLGRDFRLFLKADDYFDFIILIMLGMGVVFQMPAVTYVLSRIGLVTASYLVRVWRVSLVVIMVAAAVLSPTNDVLNMLLFAAPMVVLYLVSIFVAWLCGRPRATCSNPT